jgi:hypothetical protein
MQIEFPCLYRVWQSTDIKHTGNNIAKMYETKIMLNPEVFKISEAQKIKLAYEYDGISIFSADNEKTILLDKIAYLVKHIVAIGQKACGLKMVLKVVFV